MAVEPAARRLDETHWQTRRVYYGGHEGPGFLPRVFLTASQIFRGGDGQRSPPRAGPSPHASEDAARALAKAGYM